MASTSTQAAPVPDRTTEPVETANPSPQPRPNETPFVIKLTTSIPG